MGKLIDGREIAQKINAATAKKVKKLRTLGITPKLAVILVGDNKASQVYVGRKEKKVKELGIDFALHQFPMSISREQLILALAKIQTDPALSGLIIQLPLPEKLYVREVLNAIKPEFDVDCLTDVNLGKLVSKANELDPPTAGAVMIIFSELKIDLIGKNVVVIGAGVLVGRPLMLLLLNARATVTVCNSKTRNLAQKCQEADIVVSGVGQTNLVRGSMIKSGAIVVDAGILVEKGTVSGDINVDEVLPVASFVTPTPGGLGPITVAKLLENVVLSAERKLKRKK